MASMNMAPDLLRCRGLSLDLRHRAHVVGILNVTPDSFSDGGQYMQVENALRRALKMASEGVRMIDVGGASSRPRGTVYGEGAQVVSPHEEMARIVPVIERIAAALPGMIISADTYHPDVAHAALDAGAHLINDITGLRRYPAMAELVASYDAALVLMHSTGHPGEMPHEVKSADVVEDVVRSLARSVHVAEVAGVTQIVVDPGFGFGKTPADNLRLIGRLDRLHELNKPIMVGISRKSTIGRVLARGSSAAPIAQRLHGTLGATAVAVLRGAHLVRTHDVKPTMDLLQVMSAITESL